MSITVSPGEWKIMEEVWRNPQTLMDLVHTLREQETWSKSTVTTMVRRMNEKGLLSYETNGKTKTFHPTVSREDVVAEETGSLLERAYKGSIGLLVNTMAKRNSLTKADIEELYAILRSAEEKL